MNKKLITTGISVTALSIAACMTVGCSKNETINSTNTHTENQNDKQDNDNTKKHNVLDFNDKTAEEMRLFYTNEGQEFIKKILPESLSSDLALLNVGKSIDKEFKDIKFKTINDKEIYIKDLKGKKVFLDFALATCHNCEEELNFLSSYDFEKEDIVYLHIFPRDNTSSIKSLYSKTNSKLKESNIISTTGINGLDFDDFGITNVPAKIFIDEKGVVQYAYVGKITDRENLELHIERAFNKNIPKMLDYLKSEEQLKEDMKLIEESKKED